MGRIIPIDTLDTDIKTLHDSGKRIISTNGCFDILHPGHIDYLKRAKTLGDVLIVGLNSDVSVQKLKGPSRPINDEVSRSILMSHLIMVDYVVVFNEQTPLEFIKKVRPHIHVKGGDYKKEDLPEYPIVTSLGGTIEILPFIPGYSSTSIIQKIQHLK